MGEKKPVWRKSTYSGGSGGCVEITEHLVSDGIVPVRDSKLTDSPEIHLTTAAFSRLVEYAKTF